MQQASTPAPARSPAEPLRLHAIRGFHVGGHVHDVSGQPSRAIDTVPGVTPRTSDPNGRHLVGQLYVQQFTLAEPRFAVPLLFWHGGGMTGCTWEDTPDGRPGWHDYFMRQGWTTCVSDAVERGRASWAPYPALNAQPPEHRTLEQAWTLFRLGAASADHGAPFPGQRFPVQHLEQFGRQFVARWTSQRDLAIAAYVALLQRTGPAVVIAHSEGGRLAQAVAHAVPELVKALVLVEPAGGLNPAQYDHARLQPVPHCVVWGDYLEHSPVWRSYRQSADQWLAAVASAGAVVDVLDLPALGIRGNSHMPMMDDNSDDVAARVQAWLAARLAPTT